jgi:DNA-binding CsgD family transcriptional regulator/PAS domain-containing protein
MSRRIGSEIVSSDVLALVELVYEAAGDDGLWTPFLEGLMSRTGDEAVALTLQDLRRPGGEIVAQVGFDPGYQERYAEHYGAVNPWLTRSRVPLAIGAVSPTAAAFPEEQLVKTEFYSDYLAPQGLFRGLGLVVSGSETSVAVLTLMRSRDIPDYGPPEERLMSHLAPHLQRAFLLRSRLGALREERRASLEALDALPSALLLLDADGRPILVNRAARRILRARDGLFVDSDGLRAATPSLTSRLRDLLRRTALPLSGASPDGGDVLRLPRPSGAPALVALATPLPPSSRPPGGAGAAVALFLRDPANEPVASTTRLERLYDLTPAEARLAARLAAGEGLDEAADALGVRRETVRSQLKSVFAKTGTRRQGELLRKLALDAALLPEPDPPA